MNLMKKLPQPERGSGLQVDHPKQKDILFPESRCCGPGETDFTHPLAVTSELWFR